MWRNLLQRIHPQGIPWPASLVYNAISRGRIFQDHYRLVAEDILARCPQGSRVPCFRAARKACSSARRRHAFASESMAPARRRDSPRQEGHLSPSGTTQMFR